MADKMTNRDFYNAVINGNVNDEVITFAKEAIEKMNARNEARKGKVSGKAKENLAKRFEILNKMEAGVQYTAAIVAEQVGLTQPQASGALVQLAKAGYLDVTKVAVKGKGKVNAYVRTDKEIDEADFGKADPDAE